VAGCCTPVAWRAATRADAGPVGRLGRPVALAEHLDTGQLNTSSLEVVGLHRGCGAELEWPVLHRGLARGHPRQHGARPRRAASAPGSPVALAEHLDIGQTPTPSLEVVGLHS